VADDLPGSGPVPTIERRLSAARLSFRKLNLDTEVFEHLHGRRGYVVVKCIAEAGCH
jgi:hypothetical protein